MVQHPVPVTEAGTQDEQVADALSERDREILAFERQWWKYAGAKETAVREKFDMSSTRYYQVLNALIDRPEALEADLAQAEAEMGAGGRGGALTEAQDAASDAEQTVPEAPAPATERGDTPPKS